MSDRIWQSFYATVMSTTQQLLPAGNQRKKGLISTVCHWLLNNGYSSQMFEAVAASWWPNWLTPQLEALLTRALTAIASYISKEHGLPMFPVSLDHMLEVQNNQQVGRKTKRREAARQRNDPFGIATEACKPS